MLLLIFWKSLSLFLDFTRSFPIASIFVFTSKYSVEIVSNTSLLFFCDLQLLSPETSIRYGRSSGSRSLWWHLFSEAGVRSMRAAFTCRAMLIANRFIGPAILLEFNAILCARRRTTNSTSRRYLSPLLTRAIFRI